MNKQLFILGAGAIIPKDCRLRVGAFKRGIAHDIGLGLLKYKKIEFKIKKLKNGDREITGNFGF